jgi:hypothetical protein
LEKKKSAVKLKMIHTTRFGLVLIILAIVLVVLLSMAGRGPVVTIQLKEGISVFAVFYLMAQFIERVVEPFSEIKRPMKEKTDPKKKANTGALFSDTERIKILRKEVDITPDEEKETELDKLDAKRVIAMWGLTSFLGILLCYFTVGLFEVVGVSFHSLAVAGRTITGHTVDSILSGMIVGGGTKPLHDLIGYIEKAQSAKSP